MKSLRPLFRFLGNISKSKLSIAVVVLCFGVVGSILLITSHAVTPTGAFEAESGTLNSNAKAVTDTTASGGKAVKFTASTTNLAVSNTCAAGYPHPSGMLIPTGDLTSNGSTWDQVYADDFSTDPFARPNWEDGLSTTPAQAVGTGNSTTNYMTDSTKKAALLNNQYNIWKKNSGADGAYASSSWSTSNVTDVNNECLKVASTYNGTNSFVTGGLASSYLHSIKYGRWEAAFRMDNSSYVKYAYMLYGLSYGHADDNWPKYVEEDLAEGNANGVNSSFSTTNHYGAAGSSTKSIAATSVAPADGTTFSSWHRQAVEWKPGEMDYYLDGKKFVTIKSIAYAPAGTAADSSCAVAAAIARGFCYVPADSIPDNLSGDNGEDLGLRRLIFQTESIKTGATASTPVPDAYIDWVAIWQLQQ